MNLSQSQVIQGRQIAGAGVLILWAAAAVMMAISTFGNYVQLVGGWRNTTLDNIAQDALLYAVAWQAFCFVGQWAFKARQQWALYVLFLAISAVPSILTYHAWAGDYLNLVTGLSIGGWLLVVIGAVLNDMAPEWILIK